jgi:hypothetical protein
MDTLVSRLDSGRAILKDPPHVDFPGSSLVCVRREGAHGVWKSQRLGKGKSYSDMENQGFAEILENYPESLDF